MSRFSFIPLEFEKLSEGLEREIVLKKDTSDIYILDDYKVPVSSTSNLKGSVNDLKIGVTSLVTKSENLKQEYILEKDRVIRNSNNLNDLITEGESNHFKRVNGLEDYNTYLEGYHKEIEISLLDFKQKIEDMVNIYYSDLTTTINSVTNKYNSNLELYNVYVGYKTSYDSAINSMEREIDVLYNELATKLKKLGEGSGKYDGTIVQDTRVTKELTSWFRWLSNSPTVYPGPRVADSFEDGLSWYRYDNPKPLKPYFFAGDYNPSQSNYSDWEGPSGNPNAYLVAYYWDGPLENTGFTSETNHYNKYGRKIKCIYQREFGAKIDVPIHIDI